MNYPTRSARRVWPLLPLLAIGAIGTAAPAAAQPVPIELLNRVEAARVAQKIPGLAVLVLRGGKVVHAGGLGTGNVELATPVTPDARFQSGSLGKMFTAALVLMLAQDGKLQLDDPIRRHLPDAPQSWSGITVRMMLNHTSGLGNFDLPTYQALAVGTLEDQGKAAYAAPLLFAPGTDWRYSNTAYVMLGLMVQRLTGRFYADLLVERLFRPLGMKTAMAISEHDIVPGRVAGYQLDDGVLKNQDYLPQVLNSTADGSLYLSANDYAAWEQAVRVRHPVLRADSWDQMLGPGRLKDGRPVAYGFGWNVRAAAGLTLRAHGGSWQGFQTYYLAVGTAGGGDGDLAVVVLSNLANARPAAIAQDLAKGLMPAATGLIDCLAQAPVQPCPAVPSR